MKKRACSLFLALFPCLMLLYVCCAEGPKGPVDLDVLRSSGDDWTVRQDTTADGGVIRLHHDKWLMYFVHWRPLTEERERLSIEYVRDLMLNFWGADMPFTLTEKVEEMEVAGHKAYLVDGTIYEGAIQSRLIVWNCPETERQLIADCNINLKKGTPPELLELQNDITLSVSCHGAANVQKHPSLNHLYVSKMFNLSFRTPETWRTEEYWDSAWFPNGMTPTNGTLWTLLTDSEKYVELRWENRRSEVSTGLFNRFIERIESDSVVSETTLRITDIKVRGTITKKECIVGHGNFKYNLRAGDREVTKPFRFSAFHWNRDDKTYFLLAGMASIQEFWGISPNLSPTDETFNRFVQDEVLANTTVFNKEYTK
ncbi:MAG: hypothetical protein JSV10_03325 [Candidatus Zixiibacteriota bacterium]|nr:MAG: hypothetical protein JSV10_03325 [candidate division Zixibacteria bacterium]